MDTPNLLKRGCTLAVVQRNDKVGLLAPICQWLIKTHHFIFGPGTGSESLRTLFFDFFFLVLLVVVIRFSKPYI